MVQMTKLANEFIRFVRQLYQTENFIPLHEPVFRGNEKAYVNAVIDSTFVSSVGETVNQFERQVADYVETKYAVATVNGTAALHVSLILAGVKTGEQVLTQSLSFVATANAIRYCDAEPVFIDVDRKTLGLSAQALAHYLNQNAEYRKGETWDKQTGKRIAACVPMHTLGHPCEIDKIVSICADYAIPVVEDAAEALGSYYQQQHCGTFGLLGVFSFNGNKIITTGGGGMIVTDDEQLALHAKHLTTTAKTSDAWRFFHDEVGYNYRMPNLNAALGVAQLEQLPDFIRQKRDLAEYYANWAVEQGIQWIQEPDGAQSNYWLNALCLTEQTQQHDFLSITNEAGVMTRPLWEPLHHLPMYQGYLHDDLAQTEWLAKRLLNVPSGVKEMNNVS